MFTFQRTIKTGFLVFISAILLVNNAMGQTTRLIVIDPLVITETGNTFSSTEEQKVIVLPDEGNPLKFITTELISSRYDEIHLFILTKQGSIIFDEINIIPENIQEYSEEFRRWKSITKPGFKIFIHSESLVTGEEGLFLVKRISEYTGREVMVR